MNVLTPLCIGCQRWILKQIDDIKHVCKKKTREPRSTEYNNVLPNTAQHSIPRPNLQPPIFNQTL